MRATSYHERRPYSLLIEKIFWINGMTELYLSDEMNQIKLEIFERSLIGCIFI